MSLLYQTLETEVDTEAILEIAKEYFIPAYLLTIKADLHCTKFGRVPTIGTLRLKIVEWATCLSPPAKREFLQKVSVCIVENIDMSPAEVEYIAKNSLCELGITASLEEDACFIRLQYFQLLCLSTTDVESPYTVCEERIVQLKRLLLAQNITPPSVSELDDEDFDLLHDEFTLSNEEELTYSEYQYVKHRSIHKWGIFINKFTDSRPSFEQFLEVFSKFSVEELRYLKPEITKVLRQVTAKTLEALYETSLPLLRVFRSEYTSVTPDDFMDSMEARIFNTANEFYEELFS